MYGLSKIWSKNYLYDHFNQRLHIHQTCYFTQVLIFHCPVSQRLQYHLLQLVISGKAIPPFFFRWAANAFPDIGSVVRIEKKKLKTKYHKKCRNRGPWYPRMTLKVNIYIFGLTKWTMWKVQTQAHFSNRFQSLIVRVNVVLNALFSIARLAAMFVVSQASTWLWHMRDLIYVVTYGFWTNRIAQNELPLNSSNSRGLHKQHSVANRVVLLFSDNRKTVFL